MQLDLFSAFRNNAEFNGVLFYYNGALSQNVINTMSDTLKQRLAQEEGTQTKARKLFSSFIEMVQNALFYSPNNPDVEGEKIGSVAVGKDGDKFYVVCGNLVESKYADRIREKVEPLRSMTLDEIKAAYRTQLKNEMHHEEDKVSKGAGLGFLTVARDASEPIEYRLVEVPTHEELAYFYLKAVI
ncbi:SiaB family protein kinase [Leeia sp. TBRC 13508]|uniref:SiaB family protein kinase n=1 Tax=Leeia speluncae TaxID=2884804 RepID=A0ABS8D3Z2_9NEIS|nr:SiaB family protein kinase [Leeia speluncae]MCB6182696.1 SiaB family protein kinase [Leeia speluncae]